MFCRKMEIFPETGGAQKRTLEGHCESQIHAGAPGGRTRVRAIRSAEASVVTRRSTVCRSGGPRATRDGEPGRQEAVRRPVRSRTYITVSPPDSRVLNRITSDLLVGNIAVLMQST